MVNYGNGYYVEDGRRVITLFRYSQKLLEEIGCPYDRVARTTNDGVERLDGYIDEDEEVVREFEEDYA